MKTKRILLAILCTISIAYTSKAANRYWIAASTANWNSTLNWSTTSGGAGGASVPGSGDIAIFNGSGTGNCTINATVNVAGFSIVSGYTGTISQGANTVTVGTSHFSQAAGTFTGGSVTIDINGTFTLSGGTFTATTSDFKIGSSVTSTSTIFTHSGGTFNHNNGTTIFDANNSTNTFTVDVITATQFYNVKVEHNSGISNTSTMQSGTNDTIKAVNDFTHQKSALKGVWRVQGNFIVGSMANGGTGNTIMYGTGNKTYAFTSGGRASNLIINKSSGTVTSAFGTTDFSVQSFKLTAGSFTSPTGNLNIGGTWASNATVFEHVAGTFTHNSATTVFDMNGSFTFTIKPLSTTTFYNVTINSKGTQVLQNATDTLRTDNNLTLTQGSFNTGVIKVKKDVIVTNTFGGTGTIAFMSTGNPQNFTLTGATDKFNVTNLIIKTNKRVILQSAAILDQSGQTLTLTKGLIQTSSANLLTIGHGVTVSGASNTSYVEGPIKKVGNAAFTFPVGRNDYYRSIAISAPSATTDAYTAEYFEESSHNTYSHNSKDGSIAQLSRNEFWTLNRNAGSTNVNVTLSWNTSATSCTFASTANLKVAAWDGTTWKDKGNGGTTGTTSAGTIVTSGTSNVYGPYTLATTATFACLNDVIIDGEFPTHTATIEIDSISGDTLPIVYDRFGNTYNLSDITHGSCTPDWTTDMPQDQSAGFFNINYCTNGVFDPFNTDVRAVIEQVFEDISTLIDPQQCGVNDPVVNIQITAPTSGLAGTLAAASQFYIPEWEVCMNLSFEDEGILYGQVWRAINTGVNNPNLMDAQIAINFNDYTFNDNYPSATPSNEYDLYTVVLHEVLHCLGFASLIDANGDSRLAGTGFYSRYDTHLESNDTRLIGWGLANLYSPTPPAAADLVGDCSTIILTHDGAYTADVDIANWNEGMFSHFSNICNSSTSRVMLPGLPPAVDHRQMTNDDVNVLLDLGYEITGTFPPNSPSSTPSGGPGVIGRDDGFTHWNNDCATRLTMQLCEDPADFLTITDDMILANDINADGIEGFHSFLGYAPLNTIIAGQEWEFHPTVPGLYRLRYTPVNNPVSTISVNTVGNSACVLVEVFPCDPLAECHEPDACNLICNPDFEHPDALSCANLSQYQTNPGPSWTFVSGTPDWMNCPGGGAPNAYETFMFAQHYDLPFQCEHGSEGIMTNVNIVQGQNYTLSYFRRKSTSYSSIVDKLFIRLFNSATTPGLQQFFDFSCTPEVPTPSQLIVEETNITSSAWVQVTVCFTADDDYDRLWIYPEATTSSLQAIHIDRVMLVEDTYNAGVDDEITCLQEIDLGVVACEVDNADYSWSIVGVGGEIGDEQVIPYEIDGPNTFQVIRSYPTNPATVSIPVADDNCTLTDEIVITTTGEGCSCGTASTNSGSWPKQGGGDEKVSAYTVLAADNGDVYVTGYFYDGDNADITGFASLTPNTAIDMFVAKYAVSGGTSWIRQFGNDVGGNTTDNTGFDLAIGWDCNLIVTGKYDNGITLDGISLTSGTPKMGFVMKLDKDDGSVLEAADLVAGNSFHAVAVSGATGKVYTMSKDETTAPNHTVVVKQFDEDLNLLDTETFGVVAGDLLFSLTDNITRGIAVDASDNVYVTMNLTSTLSGFGTTPAVTLFAGGSVAKLNSSLSPVTGRDLTANNSYAVVRDIVAETSGVTYVTGAHTTTAIRVSQLPAALTSTTASYGYNSGYTGTSIDLDGTNFYFSGMNGSNFLGGKANKSTGTQVFTPNTYSSTSTCNSVSADGGGNLFIAGAFQSSVVLETGTLTATNSNRDMFVARLDDTSGDSFKTDEEDGNTNPENGSISERTNADFEAMVYPNPTTGKLLIQFRGISSKETITTDVFDVAGSRILSLQASLLQDNVAEIDLGTLANGVYLLKITAGANKVFHKITLAK